jgi:hypothetical protein
MRPGALQLMAAQATDWHSTPMPRRFRTVRRSRAALAVLQLEVSRVVLGRAAPLLQPELRALPSQAPGPLRCCPQLER